MRIIYRNETFTLSIIEGEEHFAEVGLRLTPRLRREMRLTKFIFHIFSTNNAGYSRLSTNNLDLCMHVIQIFHWYSMKVLRGQIEANRMLLENLLINLPNCQRIAVTVMKLSGFIEPWSRNILPRSD